MVKAHNRSNIAEYLWDLWCVVSVIGIWPRFIEPNIFYTTKLQLPIRKLPKGLSGLKILHFSDLHFCRHISDRYLHKILSAMQKFRPDLILFTGDLICYSELVEKERLEAFLKAVASIPSHGVWCVLGNHDYERFVSIDDEGQYTLVKQNPKTITRAFKRLWNPPPMPSPHPADLCVPLHQELMDTIRDCNWNLLHNRTEVLHLPGGGLNLCGFGEYMMGDVKIDSAYALYDSALPGILLLHNPDGAPLLKEMPGDVILSGHTHGGQVNLPWINKRFSLMEHPEFKKGLIQFGDKQLYVTRGIGSVLPFRWLAPPELVTIELTEPSCLE